MPKITFYHDKRHLKKDGTAPLKIIFSNKGKQTHISTSFSIPPECWDGEWVIPYPKGFKGKKIELNITRTNRVLKEFQRLALNFLNSLSNEEASSDVSKLREMFIIYLDQHSNSYKDDWKPLVSYKERENKDKKKGNKVPHSESKNPISEIENDLMGNDSCNELLTTLKNTIQINNNIIKLLIDHSKNKV